MRTYASSPLKLIFAALLVTIGCASGHTLYRGEEPATALLLGRPALVYPLPPRSALETPHGEVRMAVLGIATIAPRGADGAPVRAVHVTLVADNHDDRAPWQLDTRRQIGGLVGRGQSRAAFAASSVGQPPIVTIQPGSVARVDLYYPLPHVMQRVTQVGQFDLLWLVTTPEGAFADEASFGRMHLEAPARPDIYAWDIGWWGPSWYDPLWTEETFVNPTVVHSPPGVELTNIVTEAPPPPRMP
jgi:hypothetical protein